MIYFFFPVTNYRVVVMSYIQQKTQDCIMKVFIELLPIIEEFEDTNQNP